MMMMMMIIIIIIIIVAVIAESISTYPSVTSRSRVN
jgi:hypothetical protein